jgi:tryptophan 2,3-dioxygenase
MENLLADINKKYNELGHDPNVFLKGLHLSKPLSYWDYIQLDTLMSLQKPKTDFADEYIFIVYHQITELILALINHELQQVIASKKINQENIKEKVDRINRYMEMMDTSFAVMFRGMNWNDYNIFRIALAPASGFQAVSFRLIELMCTDLINLVKPDFRKKHTTFNATKMLKDIYWQDAGLDRKTGKKSLTLKMFEEKYLHQIIEHAEKMKGKNLLCIIQTIKKINPELKISLRKMDYLFNVKWPLSHLRTAEHYLISKGQKTASTGMSDWQKYLHPHYQRRIFFPNLWTKNELSNWGNFEL